MDELKEIYDTLHFFDHRWTLEILSSLSAGAKRFNALQRDVGNVNAKTHRDALQRLIGRGLVERPTNVDGVHYTLTPSGERALPLLRAFVCQLSRCDVA
jgi:DNA-binding HxlR family transcriptional regulator